MNVYPQPAGKAGGMFTYTCQPRLGTISSQ